MQIGISPFATTVDTVLELSSVSVSGGLGTLWSWDGYLSNPDIEGWSGDRTGWS